MAAVSVAAGAMNALLGKLGSVLVGEYKMLKDVPEQVDFLKRELGVMNIMLHTLAGEEELDPQMSHFRDTMRELSYDIEDCIDLFVHHAGRSGGGCRGFMEEAVSKLESMKKRHEIARQVLKLKDRVVEETQRHKMFKLDHFTKPCTTNDMDPRLPALYTDAKSLVAIDGPRDKIVSWLRDGQVELKVISIVGCGGLGKTTLAMAAYSKTRDIFQCRASVSVSRTLDLKRLLKGMLFQINEQEYQKAEMWEVEQLIHKVRQLLTSKRYLILIDDIWKTGDWEFVKIALPDNDKCSRIIVTTRLVDVAKSCCSSFSNQIYEMAPPCDMDSRKLFLRRIFPSENCCPTQLKNVCDGIIKRCCGLPLAIITLSSVLANKLQTKDEWEFVLHRIGLTYENDCILQRMRKILLHSYYDLPHQLKACLLYTSIYPEDHEIDRRQLISKWIAEGFITERRGQSLQETADGYFTELVNRSVIQPIDIWHDGKARACRVHDLMLDVIISLATEENFSTVLFGRGRHLLPNKIRRLSLQSCYEAEQVLKGTMNSNKPHIRSVSTFDLITQIPELSGFHAVRVLYLNSCSWLENYHIRSIASLFQLRYLRLSSARISELPEELGTLKYLETLDLRDCYRITKLPSTIVQLRKLVRLFVEDDTKLPDEIGEIESLEEISDAASCNNTAEFVHQLGRLTKMRTLFINYHKLAEKCDDLEHCNKIMVSSLSELGRHGLRSLWIESGDYVVESLMGGSSCTLAHIQQLCIGGQQYPISQMPNGVSVLVNLIDLRIHVERINEKDLLILGAIPSLLFLFMMFSNDPKERLVIGNQGFRRLKELFVRSQGGGGLGVVFAPGAMPELQRLCLDFKARGILPKYEGVDIGIEHLKSLSDIVVEIYCFGATKGEVEAVEVAIMKAAHLLLNSPAFRIRRFLEDEMVEDKEKVDDDDNTNKKNYSKEIS